jgi:hypothetical protein
MPNFKYKIPSQKNVSEESTISSNSFFTSGGEGENHNGPSPRKSTYGAYTQAGYKKVTEGPGATMGPGPKAGEEGVKDNVYVKKFKYTLVNQKALNKAAKGIEVKALWEAEDIDKFLEDMRITDPSKREFISSRLRAFDEIEEKKEIENFKKYVEVWKKFVKIDENINLLLPDELLILSKYDFKEPNDIPHPPFKHLRVNFLVFDDLVGDAHAF